MSKSKCQWCGTKIPSFYNPELCYECQKESDLDDFVDSFFKEIPVDNLTPVPIVESGSSVDDAPIDWIGVTLCSECGFSFPLDQLDPDTNFCLKCKADSDAHENRAQYANQD